MSETQKMIWTFVSKSKEETQAFGARMGAVLKPGDVICLEGALGAGKTTLAQGIARGLGVIEDVTSPTFTIIQEYLSGRMPLRHFDFYRIETPEEIQHLGFEDYLDSDGVVLTEWHENLGDYAPTDRIRVQLSLNEDASRQIVILADGERYQERLKELKANC
jgi:tRNA threonylcarbamoyladenosine biosynthesis protein TsaE